MRIFRPDFAFCDIYTITPEALFELGVKGIVFDIDNTLAPYEMERPDEKLQNYLTELKNAGIKMAFVSNNHGPRVKIFNESLGFYYVCKAGKPSPKGVKKCIQHFGLEKNEVMAIGDQIFTDCLAAHNAGIRFAMVKPIQPKESLFFRIKRFFERPFVRGLKWLNSKDVAKYLKRKKKNKKEKDT